MITRPFQTICVPKQQPGVIEVHVHFPHNITDEGAVSRLDQCFVMAERFAALGGLGGRTIPPTQSSLVLQSRDVSGLGRASWRFTEANVDPALLFLIANIVHLVALIEADVEQLVFVSSLCDRFESPQSQEVSRFEPLPFHFEDLTEGRRVVVCAEFKEYQIEAQRASFVEAWQVWLSLASAGAFSDDDYPPGESGVIVIEPPQSVPARVMFIHERFRLSDTSLNCLVNAFHALHSRIAPIEELVLS